MDYQQFQVKATKENNNYCQLSVSHNGHQWTRIVLDSYAQVDMVIQELKRFIGMDWVEALRRVGIAEVELNYKTIGLSIITPEIQNRIDLVLGVRSRYNHGDRSRELYDQIMAIK